MASSKLVHLKPTLWRSYKRAIRRQDALASRFVAGGMEDRVLHVRVDRARDRMLDLAGKCHAIECAIERALNRAARHDRVEDEQCHPVNAATFDLFR